MFRKTVHWLLQVFRFVHVKKAITVKHRLRDRKVWHTCTGWGVYWAGLAEGLLKADAKTQLSASVAGKGNGDLWWISRISQGLISASMRQTINQCVTQLGPYYYSQVCGLFAYMFALNFYSFRGHSLYSLLQEGPWSHTRSYSHSHLKAAQNHHEKWNWLQRLEVYWNTRSNTFTMWCNPRQKSIS